MGKGTGEWFAHTKVEKRSHDYQSDALRPAPAVVTAGMGLIWIEPRLFKELFDDHSGKSLTTAP
jgi:hypothetical protein